MLKTITLLLLLLSAFSQVYAIPEEDFKKLSPEPVQVLLENGKGSLEIVFARKAGITPPPTRVTAAFGSNNSISEKEIHFDWVTATTSEQPTLLEGRLWVETQSFVDHAAPYKGKIILLWPNAQPTTIDYQIVNSTSIGFDVYPEQVDQHLAILQPHGTTLRIKNTGKSKITNLVISSLGLVDTATGHKIDPPAKSSPIDLDPLQEKPIAYEWQQPLLAGAYSGALDITANNSTRKSIAVVLRTRGPGFRPLLFLPFVLFVAVLVLGFWLSWKLDQWFGQGGLQRAQTIQGLRRSQTDLTEGLRSLQRWQDEHPPAKVPRSTVRLQLLTDELITVLRDAENLPLTQLTAEAQRFASQVAVTSVFWSVVKIATGKFPPAGLPGVTKKLDDVAIPQPLDLDVYRQNLLNVLQAETNAAGLGGAGVVAPPAPRVISPEALEKRIKFMALLYQFVVWFVVFVTAYQTLYLNDRSFGTLLDYLIVFLWALGLTKTGTQILTGAQSSYKPASP
jgi:hypothetical protein